jgi:hypothetical protein
MDNLTRDDFIQAKLFMFSDIEREIELAKADGNALQAAGVKPGGGNILAALGLLCYTEFGGKLQFGEKHSNENFNKFFNSLGTEYQSFQAEHKVYDVFRCGLTHEYFVKKNCTIAMLANGLGPGIGIDLSGQYFFIVESYWRDLKKAFNNLQVTLYGQ